MQPDFQLLAIFYLTVLLSQALYVCSLSVTCTGDVPELAALVV